MQGARETTEMVEERQGDSGDRGQGVGVLELRVEVTGVRCQGSGLRVWEGQDGGCSRDVVVMAVRAIPNP